MDINSKWLKIVDKCWFTGLPLVILIMFLTIFFYNFDSIYNFCLFFYESMIWTRGSVTAATGLAYAISIFVPLWLSISAVVLRMNMDTAQYEYKITEDKRIQKELQEKKKACNLYIKK